MTRGLHVDLILRDANLLEPSNPPGRSGALAIRSGRIVASGSDHEIEVLSGPGTKDENMGGRTVMPGLIDSHIHLERYAQSLAMVDCATPDLETCLDRLGAAAQVAPAGAWIQGHGWDQNHWGRWPTADALDSVAPDRPVYLTAHSLHAAAANSLALAHVEIEPSTPDPPRGRIQRDARGEPTGVLLEEAMALVSDHLPAPTTEATATLLTTAQEQLWRVGLTGVHDFDGGRCLSALQLLRSRDLLGVRVVKHLRSHQLGAARELGLRSGLGDDWLRIGNIKIFTDGALGPRTASMIEPYDDDPTERGLLLLEEDEILEIARHALLAGFALAIHAIGDRANRTALSALARLARALPDQKPPFPHRIEHVQLLDRQDVPRLHQLGIVASMQPVHALSDRAMAEAAWGERTELSYPWHSLERAGTVLTFGSDAPVEDPNPFWGLHAAICRCPRGEGKANAWTPDQRISLRSALAGYTSAPSSISGTAGDQGSLRAGSHADLIVLDEDPFAIAAEEIFRLAPVATMVAGEWRARAY